MGSISLQRSKSLTSFAGSFSGIVSRTNELIIAYHLHKFKLPLAISSQRSLLRFAPCVDVGTDFKQSSAWLTSLSSAFLQEQSWHNLVTTLHQTDVRSFGILASLGPNHRQATKKIKGSRNQILELEPDDTQLLHRSSKQLSPDKIIIKLPTNY